MSGARPYRRRLRATLRCDFCGCPLVGSGLVYESPLTDHVHEVCPDCFDHLTGLI